MPDDIRFQTKPEIALQQMRQAMADGVPPGAALMDPTYGNDSKLCAGISELGLSYVAGILPTMMVWRPGCRLRPEQASTGPARGCAATRRISLLRPRPWLWNSPPRSGSGICSLRLRNDMRQTKRAQTLHKPSGQLTEPGHKWQAGTMKISGREPGVLLSALFKRRNYIAALNMLRVYKNPVDGFWRYLLGRGRYPADLVVNTASGTLPLTVYSYHDVLTVNEIFCRLDYPVSPQQQVIVDFGSNIGMSAAYFLTSAPDSFVYLYEPLPFNINRLRANLRQFEGRYALHEVAVGEADGVAEFGWEDSGRYGGVGLKTGKYLPVPCRDSNKVLEEVITRHGRIDILKIDIETLERQVTERIPVPIARNICRVYVEYPFASNPLEQTHNYRMYGNVAQFFNKVAAFGPT